MKKSGDKLDEAVRLAEENNMTYAELQTKETLGLVKIKDGKLIRTDTGQIGGKQ